MSYPRWKYPVGGGERRLVANQAEDDALGPSWRNDPIGPPVKCTLGLTALDATSAPLTDTVVEQARDVKVYVNWTAGCTAGAVAIEEAHAADFTGTWARIARVDFVAADQVDAISVPGVAIAVRARVLEVIAGGTVGIYSVTNVRP